MIVAHAAFNPQEKALKRSTLILLAFALLVSSGAALAQVPIQQSRGGDARVDYTSLAQFGPWDDRNYELTREDLALLADNEADLNVAVPAFYRVQMRREIPEMLREGRVQYPHSSLPMFKARHGGFVLNGRVYNDLEFDRATATWSIMEGDAGIDKKDFQRALEGEAMVNSFGTAAESAVSINHVTPNLVIAGANGPSAGQTMFWSNDGGETWTQAAALPLGGTCCDPTVAWSSDGAKGYTATLGSGVFVYRTADGGQTWTDFDTEPGNDPRRELGSGVDKEIIHVDTFLASPFVDHVYLTWHQGNVLRVATSTDFGNNWTTHIESSATASRGIGSDVATDKNGHAYHFWPAFSSRTIRMSKSTDGGANWGADVSIATTEGSFIFPIPSIETREAFIYVSADTDRTNGTYANSIYAAWTDSTAPTTGSAANNHARIQVAYSRDAGATWTVTTPHSTADANTVDRWHQWLGVGPDGTVYCAYYDTRNSTGRTGVDFYVATSTDGAQTWSAPQRLTAETSPNLAGGFEFGDYNGMDVQMNQFIAIFTDSRTSDGSSSADVYTAGFLTVPPLFTDGFESGDTSAWDLMFP